MIPGTNKIVLSKAALIEAVQQYLDGKSGARLGKVSDADVEAVTVTLKTQVVEP